MSGASPSHTLQRRETVPSILQCLHLFTSEVASDCQAADAIPSWQQNARNLFWYLQNFHITFVRLHHRHCRTPFSPSPKRPAITYKRKKRMLNLDGQKQKEKVSSAQHELTMFYSMPASCAAQIAGSLSHALNDTARYVQSLRLQTSTESFAHKPS